MNAETASDETAGAIARRRPVPLLRRWFPGGRAGGFVSIATGLLLWESVGRLLITNSLFLATPSQIAAEIYRMTLSGDLLVHMGVSGAEFAIGLAIAIVAGIAVGFMVAISKPAQAALGPWISALYATPTVAVAPLIILWFGIGLWSKVFVVAVNAIFPMIINTESGLKATDDKLIEAVRCFGAGRFQILWDVMLPSALPYILAGVRLAVGRAIVAVVVGELFGSRAGLGFMISQASEVFNMPRLFAAVVILALVGMVMTGIARLLERSMQPWNR